MPYLLGLLLALAAAALIAWPLLRARRTGPPSALPGSLDELREVQWQRRQVYDEIRTLSLDSELGNVPAEEYAEAISTHRLRAALLLRQEEQLRSGLVRMMREIEDEVLALRLANGSVLRTTACSGCGGVRDADAEFCPMCETGGSDLSVLDEEATWAEP